MKQGDRTNNWLIAVLFAVLAYTVSGFATAALAGAAGSSGLRTFWRLAGWVLPLITFGVHIWYERIRLSNPTVRTALHVASAVAVGAFVVAAGGPAASHWGERGSRVWLSLVLWPIVTGVPALIAALVAAPVLWRASGIGAEAMVGDAREKYSSTEIKSE